MDIGHLQTEKILKQMEKEIAKEYAQAEREIAAKLSDYLEKFESKDELKRKAVANGLITQEEYEQWRVGQIMMGKRWAEMRDTLAEDFTNADKIAKSIAFGHMPEVYALNHDYGTFQVEKASLVDTSYTLYDRHAVEELMKNEDFIPAPGRKITRRIKEGKDLAWNKRQVQSVMMQGLLQGESIPKLSTRLAKTVGETDRKVAVRNARTMTTGVQNAGRVASYERANQMGIETRKQWLATLDSRTRHWHASLDGVTVDNDKPFVNDFGEIMFPGDPKAAPANIYNCRCTLIASIKGFERNLSDMNLRRDEKLGDMSYEEWREGHYKQESNPILKPEEVSEAIRMGYVQEYRGLSKVPGHRIQVVDNKTGISYTVKTKKELTDSANIIKDYAEMYSDRPSKWSGNIIVDNKILQRGDGGAKEWNCDITLTEISDDGTILHELLHSCSASYHNPLTFRLNQKIEEGSVDYLSSLICRENNVPYNLGYPDQTKVLEQLWKPLGYKEDVTFAKELFNVPLPERYGWLEKKLKKTMAANNLSPEEVDEGIQFISLLKGGWDD